MSKQRKTRREKESEKQRMKRKGSEDKEERK